VLGGIGFDVFLVAAVIVLTLGLGSYPPQKRPPDDVEPVTRLAKKKIRVPPPAAPAAHAVTPAARPTRESPKQDKTAPAVDRYDSLRKAWGS
jgi:hypothetical protein